MTVRHRGSLPASYFEALYRADPDPWRFAESGYEREKYAASLAALPARIYRRGFEIGCSIGVFTLHLAGRCESLLAVDVAESALSQARGRLAGCPHVRLAAMRVPGQWPRQDFDLIVLSEVLYYLDRTDIAAVAGHVGQTLRPGGDVLMVHWTGETDYPLSGDDAAEACIGAMRRFARPVRQERAARYRLDLLRHAGPPT